MCSLNWSAVLVPGCKPEGPLESATCFFYKHGGLAILSWPMLNFFADFIMDFMLNSMLIFNPDSIMAHAYTVILYAYFGKFCQMEIYRK